MGWIGNGFCEILAGGHVGVVVGVEVQLVGLGAAWPRAVWPPWKKMWKTLRWVRGEAG